MTALCSLSCMSPTKKYTRYYYVRVTNITTKPKHNIFIWISGICGNIITCIVIVSNKSMHTTTNYYLFSLSVSDLLLLISGMPQEMYSTWSRYPYAFGEAICILQGFAAETSANATVLTITAFTVERYMAICHPFWSHNTSKLSRAAKFVVFIWYVSHIFHGWATSSWDIS